MGCALALLLCVRQDGDLERLVEHLGDDRLEAREEAALK
jgi:hypothetical protein